MKRKICLFALFCCFSIASIPITAKSSDTAKEIDLSGSLSTEGQRSLTDPVQAYIVGQ